MTDLPLAVPVVVLAVSGAEQDVLRCHPPHARCRITKPVGFSRFLEVVRAVEHFWLAGVALLGRT